ncbi:MAG: HAMP domain-containing histidine kinase [Bacteroidetes bacterium]|nr:HAMP domain-containing histidine kinase [Bacteroidota bacterium]
MNAIRKIAVLLIAAFLLPALFFSVYEISSLNRDEEMIQDIYHRQLETILFSVNQYSDDVLGSWKSRIETDQALSANGASLASWATLQSSIQGIFSIDTTLSENTLKLGYSIVNTDSVLKALPAMLKQNGEKVTQLSKYLKSGFQKIQAFYGDGKERSIVLGFLTVSPEGTRLAGLMIDPRKFVEDILGPRLQLVGKDQVLLSIFDKSKGVSVYSSDDRETATLEQQALTRELWILPDYVLGIQTKGATLSQLVKERTRNNLLLLLGLDAVLIISVVFVFRNVKKEVQLAQNKSEFVANVSHEIRTPLALISMFAETLEMNRLKSEEKRNEYYAIISKEAQRLTGIVNRILNFSQIEAGKKELHPDKLELGKEIKALLHSYDYHLRSKGFVYEWVEAEPIIVNADKEALAEIMVNLIDNAIKYSSDQKRIVIRCGQSGEQGWVAVQDEGVGIRSEDQRHIFDKFYRVPSGNLAKVKGTGLGLALVRQLIEQMDGRITVDSAVGKGSTFTVYLPLAH